MEVLDGGPELRCWMKVLQMKILDGVPEWLQNKTMVCVLHTHALQCHDILK